MKELLYGFGGLVIGASIAGSVVWAIMSSQVKESSHDESSLMGKTGDTFDQSFLEMMIEHHEGAITMAQEARMAAKHDELKSLASEMIMAQAKEIDRMKMWQVEWGYEKIEQNHSAHH